MAEPETPRGKTTIKRKSPRIFSAVPPTRKRNGKRESPIARREETIRLYSI